MAEYVEARSLASLNALASNPPQYPTNPTAKKEEPLTLYISRVPGTRDVILSTFKPQVKNVTAEDVASSLYYIHLNTPEDELLISDSPREASSRPSLESARTTISRKPVPAVPNSSNLGKFSGTPTHVFEESYALQAGKETQPSATSAHPPPPYEPLNSLSSQAQTPPPPPIHRKPLAPKGVTLDTQARPPTPPPHEHLYVSNLPPRPDEIDNYPEYGASPPAPLLALRPEVRSPSPSKRKPFTPFSLTLIRRDRSSHQQWNVGRITSFQLDHPEQILEEKYIPSPSISIYLETPGYSKFRGMPLPGAAFDIRDITESLDAIRPGNSSAAQAVLQSSPQRARVRPAEPTPSHASLTSAHVFERQVNMTYAPSWTANLRNVFRRHGSKEDDLPTLSRRSGHERQSSNVSMGSFGAEFEGGEAPVITMPNQGLKPQGYMFVSPWDGRCEFRTGNGGRSLRCRHILPQHTSQWNPLIDGDDEGVKGHRRNRSRSPKDKGHDISELRFNLPSAEIFGTKTTDPNRPHEARERTRDRIYNSMTNKIEDDVEDEEYESVAFDMSLGREKAGGGNRGKRAKMGKLIIWDQGLKMLDLVVAANVGVWWNIWERKQD